MAESLDYAHHDSSESAKQSKGGKQNQSIASLANKPMEGHSGSLKDDHYRASVASTRSAEGGETLSSWISAFRSVDSPPPSTLRNEADEDTSISTTYPVSVPQDADEALKRRGVGLFPGEHQRAPVPDDTRVAVSEEKREFSSTTTDEEQPRTFDQAIPTSPSTASNAATKPYWIEERQPAPAPPSPPTNIRYGNRGWVTKSSIQHDSRVGAHAIDGPDASPVGSEIDDESNGESSQSETNQTKNVPWWQRRTYILIAVGLGITTLVVAVVIVVALQTFNSSSDPMGLTVLSEEKTQDKLDLTLVPNMTESTLLALEDRFSIQYLAYEWISEDLDWESYEDWRKQQRFAMTCIYFAFRGEGLLNDFLGRTHHLFHECDWGPSFELCPENDGVVRALAYSLKYPTQTGHLPPELSFLPNLQFINFDDAHWTLPFEDMLPAATTANLPLLKELKLIDCDLKGIIPSSLGLLTSLEHLDLSNNQLTSTIPSQLGLLTNLQTLVLSSNNLSGTVPEELGDLSSLTLIDVEGNPDVDM